MILGLTALGERRPTFRERLNLGAAHSAGGVLGGTAMALAAWVVVTPVRTLAGPSVARVILAGVLVVALLIDAKVIRWRDRGGQADPYWRKRFGHTRSYFLYGMLFGFSWLTFKPSTVFYAVVAVIGLAMSLPEAVAAGAIYGLAHTLLIYPASYAATKISIVLSRGRLAEPTWRAAGGVVTLGLFVLVVAS